MESIETGYSYWPADTSFPLDTEHSVGSLLATRAKEIPDVMALSGTDHAGASRELTYAELYSLAEQAAKRILTVAKTGEFIAIWAPNVIDWTIVEFGAALAGTPLVALNPVLKLHELVYALEDSQAVVLLHTDASRALDLRPVAREAVAAVDSVRSVYSFGEFLDVAYSDDIVLPDVDPQAPFMLQYTSGTTGQPKGVLIRHISALNNAKLTMEVIGAPSGVPSVNPLPMFHTASCIISTLGPVFLGGTSYLIERFDPEAVFDLIAEKDVKILYFVPTILGALLQVARKRGGPWPQVETICGGASNVPRSMIEAAQEIFGASVHNLYGQTELSPVLTAIRKSDSNDDILTTVGRPIPQLECKIVDTTTGKTVPLGVPGEICARGHSQFVKYVNKPEITAQTIDAEGWVHTGDMGFMDERGMITLTGRLKELIIRGGENISPAEIETVLYEHPAVVGVAAVGLPDENWGEIVAAVLTFDGGVNAQVTSELRALCDTKLAKYKIPARFFSSDQMPQTPTGKVKKFALKDLIQSGALTELDI